MVVGQAPDVSASLKVLVRMKKSQDIFHYSRNRKKQQQQQQQQKTHFNSASGGHVGVKRCSVHRSVCAVIACTLALGYHLVSRARPTSATKGRVW